MINILLMWVQDKHAATAIEYGLIAAGIALAIAASVFAFGDDIYNMLYEDLPSALDG